MSISVKVATSGRILAACAAAFLLARPETALSQDQKPAAETRQSARISAPAGRYEMDRNHARLQLRVDHLGLSTYVLRFNRFDIELTLEPDNPSASSVTVTVDPTSVDTAFPGDYKAGHPGSPFQNFNEDLAQSPKFLNAAQHPRIMFRSTRVQWTAPGKLRVTGDLTLLGKTNPVTLDATVVGAVAAHPFTKRGAIGFSASGTFHRSTFGMTHLLQPPVVGDAVTVQFDGEFQQAAADERAGAR